LWSPWRMKYVQGEVAPVDCVFCHELSQTNEAESLIIKRGEKAFVLLNRYPYTTGHMMVVPYAHIHSLELLDPETRVELFELASHALEVLNKVYKPDGYNLGANIGSAAGAGVAGHVHLHIVARWVGDTNYMATIGETRVLPEELSTTFQRLIAAW
ncbi:MAG: HIT domain-containing protein, partial [Anaerolineaceae bacterium]|nr:HIT domain-containing protein [Anaerolineaceae bacterium]